MRGAALAAATIAALLAAPGAGAAPVDDLIASCAARSSGDQRPVAHRVCEGRLPSFDGTELDVTLTLPARRPRGRRRQPLVVFLHGLLSSKREYLSETAAGDGPDRGGDIYKTVEWNNVWFASRGYAVLSYSARGHGDSAGSIELASRDIEVRDTHHLTGLLVDHRWPKLDPNRVAVLGSSYGGGQAWLLLATSGEGARDPGTWRSPAGRLVRLAAVVPQYTWTDLLYSLAPNGRQRTDAAPDPATSGEPIGVAKQTLINGFVATSQGKLPDYSLRWIARTNAGEPYEGDPAVAEARHGLTVERSAYHQDGFFRWLRSGRRARVPVLAAQGWTDPIFAPVETLRMYRRLRESSRGYPIQVYLGDFEHLTAQVKVPDLLYLHRLGNRMIDHFLKRKGRRPRFDVRSAQTLCDRAAFGPVVRARDWDALAPGRLRLELGGPRQTASPLSDPRAASTDPVVVSQQAGRGCITTTLGRTAGVAAYEVPLDGAVEMAGMPLLRLRYRAAAPDIQLNSRLWDVAPDGRQTLVSRGAYRAVAPDPAGADAEYELFGNHWRFEEGHRLLLEVTQDDSPFFRRDNFAGSATIESAELVLPVR
ncbi:MAG TPA: CocE/NonD family hydrolase [Thermoleophilaceae bacterium]|nr:CocE/NonD family hydrolase [Thermoleophilaceae bacterium]